MKKPVVLFALIGVLFAAGAFAADMSSIMPVLKSAKQSIDATLADIDKDMKAAAKELSTMDLKSDSARKVLNDLMKYRPYVVDCSIVDAGGIKITVEPAEYRKYEGANRTDLPYVVALLRMKKPVMSDVYHSAEGIHAIGIGYPIISGKGELIGAVRMLVRHEDFLRPLVSDKPFKIWVMQPNGIIVYDQDPEEIGRNIFSDDMFKPFDDLISFAQTVAISKTGAGSYNFYVNSANDKTLVQKIAVWDTAGIYGAEWRVIAMEVNKVLDQPGQPDKKTATNASSVK